MLKSAMLTIFGMISLTSPVLGGYKEEHEGFVKNFKGTSAFFVVICLAHLPASILLLKIVQGSSKPLFIRDFVCLVLPLLLNMTILADYCYLTIFLLIGGEIVYILRFNPYREKKIADNDMNLRCSLPGGSLLSSIARCKRMAYLNLFKGSISIFFCDCHCYYYSTYFTDSFPSLKNGVTLLSCFLITLSLILYLLTIFKTFDLLIVSLCTFISTFRWQYVDNVSSDFSRGLQNISP